MNPQLASLYVSPRLQTEQRLRKSNPPQEGGLAEASWLAPGASASFRTTPFLSERHKFDSPQLGEPIARDVVRRRWTLTTHDMHDLRGTNPGEPTTSCFYLSEGVPGVPAASHPQPGPLFDQESMSRPCFEGVSRLSRVKYDPSRVRGCVYTRMGAIVPQNSRDSRDTPPGLAEKTAERPSPGVGGVPTPAGTPRDTPGHPTPRGVR